MIQGNSDLAQTAGADDRVLIVEKSSLKRPTNFEGKLMPHYRYLIVGGGMTADAAAGGVREVDPNGSVGIISAETDRPYNRPPLTKALWKGEPLESIWRGTEKKGVEFHLGRSIQNLDIRQK